MYELITAFLNPYDNISKWVEIDISKNKVHELLNENNEVVIIVRHTTKNYNEVIKFSEIRTILADMPFSVTVGDWLILNGNKTIPSIKGNVHVETKEIKYCDAWAANWKTELATTKGTVDDNAPRAVMEDILLTKVDVDYNKVGKNSLYTVNGLLHIHDYSKAGIQIKGAGKSSMIENTVAIGIISTVAVGEVQVYPLNNNDIRARNNTLLRDGFYITNDKFDFRNKTVILSIGGFLHYAGDLFEIRSDKTILFEWSKYNFMNRYMHVSQKIDLHRFQEIIGNEDMKPITLGDELANSDLAIKEWMTLPQTFVIVIDNPSLDVRRIPLEKSHLDGRYNSYSLPDKPLQLGNGFLPPYMFFPQLDRFDIHIKDDKGYHLVNDYRHPLDTKWYRVGRISQYPRYPSEGYLLSIGHEDLVYDL